MFDISKKDSLLLKEAINDCRHFVLEKVNEVDTRFSSGSRRIKDLLEDLHHFAPE